MDSGPFKGLLIPHNACNHLPNPPAAVSPCIRLKCLPLSPISQQAISPSTLDSAPFFFLFVFFLQGQSPCGNDRVKGDSFIEVC